MLLGVSTGQCFLLTACGNIQGDVATVIREESQHQRDRVFCIPPAAVYTVFCLGLCQPFLCWGFPELLKDPSSKLHGF